MRSSLINRSKQQLEPQQPHQQHEQHREQQRKHQQQQLQKEKHQSPQQEQQQLQQQKRHQQLSANRSLIAAISKETTINEPLKPPRKHPPGKTHIGTRESEWAS